MCVNCLHNRGTWVRGVRRHLPNLGSGQRLHSYSPCSITDHGTLYSAAPGPSHQSHHLDRHRGSLPFLHNGHHNSLYPLQEEVLRQEFRRKAGAQGLVWGRRKLIPANPCPSLNLLTLEMEQVNKTLYHLRAKLRKLSPEFWKVPTVRWHCEKGEAFTRLRAYWCLEGLTKSPDWAQTAGWQGPWQVV